MTGSRTGIAGTWIRRQPSCSDWRSASLTKVNRTTPGIGLDPGDHPIDLAARAHHAPDMLDRLRAIELHKAGPCHGMNGFSGGIGNEMQMKAGHGEQLARQVIPAALCIIRRSSGKTPSDRAAHLGFPGLPRRHPIPVSACVIRSFLPSGNIGDKPECAASVFPTSSYFHNHQLLLGTE